MRFIHIFFILSLWSTVTFASSESPFPPILSLPWLKKHIQDKDLIIVDVRDKAQYQKGHIRNAINIPANSKLFAGRKLLMPKLSVLQNIFSQAGIRENSTVVAYDGGVFYLATRLQWLLKVMGHRKAAILNVSYGNWKKGEIPTDTRIPHIHPSVFVPRVNNQMIATKLDVLTSLGKVTLIDGRRESDYQGITSSAKRFGHIPTALNYPSSLTYIQTPLGNKIKNWSRLQTLFKHLDKNTKVILYCDDSAEAAMDGMILNYLGYRTRVYEGSWLEWGNDSKLPIVNPSKQKKDRYDEKP